MCVDQGCITVVGKGILDELMELQPLVPQGAANEDQAYMVWLDRVCSIMESEAK